MRKKTIVNIFHYGVKYLLIALPIILMLIAYISDNAFERSGGQPMFETNSVYAVDDLIDGNIYHLDFSADTSLRFTLCYNYSFNVDYNSISTYTTDGLTTGIIPKIQQGASLYYFNAVSNGKAVGYKISNVSLDFVYVSTEYNINLENVVPYISECTNVPYSGVVGAGLSDTIYNFFDSFVNLPINNFYNEFGVVFGLDNIDTHTPLGVMYYMPLWILYIYIFDLMLDTLCFIPKLAHNWMEKLGGYND